MGNSDDLRAALESAIVALANALDLVETDPQARANNSDKYRTNADRQRAYRERKALRARNAPDEKALRERYADDEENSGRYDRVTGTDLRSYPVTTSDRNAQALRENSVTRNAESVTRRYADGSPVIDRDVEGRPVPTDNLANYRNGGSLLPTDEEKAVAKGGLARCRETLGVRK